jgi:hypothetical protein
VAFAVVDQHFVAALWERRASLYCPSTPILAPVS